MRLSPQKSAHSPETDKEESFDVVLQGHRKELGESFSYLQGVLVHRFPGHGPEWYENVAQEAITNALTHLHGFKGKSSLKTWLATIAIRAGLLFLRKESKQKRLPILFDHLQILADPEESTQPLLAVMTHENARVMRGLVQSSLQELAPRARVLLHLYLVENQTAEEAGRALGIQKKETAKTVIRRARLELADILIQKGFTKERCYEMIS